MPFRSAAQRRYLFAKHPELARRWAAETPAGELPEHVERRRHWMHRPIRRTTAHTDRVSW